MTRSKMAITEKQQKQLDIISARLNVELQQMQKKQKLIQILQQKIAFVSLDEPMNIMEEEKAPKVQIDKIVALIIKKSNEKFPVEPAV